MSRPTPTTAPGIDAPAGRLTLAPDWEPVIVRLTVAGQTIAERQPATCTATRHRLADVALYFHRGPLAGLQLQGFAVSAPTPNGRPDWTRASVTYPSRRYIGATAEGWTVRQLRPQEPDAAQAQATIAALDRAIVARVREALDN